jgi:hypothetical protein
MDFLKKLSRSGAEAQRNEVAVIPQFRVSASPRENMQSQIF